MNSKGYSRSIPKAVGKPLSASPCAPLATLLGLALGSAQAWGLDLSPADSELSLRLDSTLSYGQMWRVQGADKNNDALNQNDGNRNFDTGTVAQVFKLTSDLALKYQNYGALVRGSGFYDVQIMDRHNDYDRHNQPPQPSQNYPHDNRFTEQTRDHAGSAVQLLDAYVYGDWQPAGHNLSARLGRQVFNWGEGLFYRGGVNTTNPLNVARLRLPGAEIKEVLVPLESLSLKFDLTDNLSSEAFYQWKWQESQYDPVGSFFSESDLFVPGSNTAYVNNPALASAAFQNQYRAITQAGLGGYGGNPYLDRQGTFQVAHIGNDLAASDSGQFGLALRYFAESLNATQFGAYFVNYHAKDPMIASSMAAGHASPDALTGALSSGAFSSYDALRRAAGGNPALRQLLGLVNGLSSVELGRLTTAQREFPENIHMYGLSFNTSLGEASVFGEVAYRPNLPIAKAALNDTVYDSFAQAPQILSGRSVMVAGEQVGIGRPLHNYERVEAWNSSLGTLYNFGPQLSFDSLVGTLEVAAEQVRGSSLKYRAFDGSIRYYAGRANKEYSAGFGRDQQIDRNAYGATLLLSGTWNDLLAGVNVSPYVVYKDDFLGNSYSGGNFIEGRKAYTLGVRASYQASIEAELQYTNFYGAGRSNISRDRDNLGLTLKYSF